MVSLRFIYQLSFYIVLSLTFLVGGFLQFFIGVSNTGLSILLGLLMFLNYVIYVLVKKKVLINWVLILFILYVSVILFSSLINGSNIISSIIYLFFPFLPLSVFYFLYINRKEGYIEKKYFYKFIFFIGLIQLPILLIQRNFYSTLIGFNNSGQHIASFDFMFGSFLMKSDHSLGCFLLFLVILLLFNINNVKKYTKNWLFLALYFSISLLLAESNISKVFLLSTWLIYFLNLAYQKIPKSFYNRNFYIAISFIFLTVLAYNIRNIDFVTSRLGGTIEQNFTLEKSKNFFDKGTAKRSQIVIVAIYKLKTKYIGDGPYSYFDIRTGDFKKTKHFSQIIWSYFDLGLIGLVTVLLYMFYLLKSTLKENKKLLIFILPIVFVYMMYTNVFFEIGIMISFFLIFSTKKNNEYSNYSIPRLEKK